MIFGNFFRKNKDVVGLDIGSSGLKLVELESTRNGYQLKNIAETALPPDSIKGKVIQDFDNVSGILFELIKGSEVKSKNAVISLSGNAVILRTLNLSPMSDDELAESVPWELSQQMNQDIERINYDYQVLPGETPEGEVRVLVVVVRKDFIESYVSMVRSAGLNPIIADVDVFALGNMYELNYRTSDKTMALINIGAAFTNFSVVRGGVPIFTRDIPVGGIRLTELIMNKQGLNFQEAEEIKQQMTKKEMPFEAEELVNEWTNEVISELKKNISLFSVNFSKDKISKTVLTGGSSVVVNLSDAVQRLVDVDVDFANPFETILIDENQFDRKYIDDISPRMGVAVGLATRSVGE